MNNIYSIGHSNRDYNQFLALLLRYQITAIADVRSVPSSRYNPDFNRSALKLNLKSHDIAYVFLGEELGGRPSKSAHYLNGRANYQAMEMSPSFLSGISRITNGMRSYRLAMMCSERHPLDCHRCLLIGRHLKRNKIDVLHIISEEECFGQSSIEEQLLSLEKKSNHDLFASDEQLLEDAYRSRSQKVAYTDNEEG